MSDNKKYYYLKLKETFFDTDAMIILESMQDGYKYSNILLKLYLRSLKGEGKLMFNDRIPYNSTILAQVTRHSVGDVEKAIQIFKELDMIEILDNGAIYISDIQNFVGESSTEADRIRQYRKRISDEKQQLPTCTNVQNENVQMYVQMSDKSTPELEIELEKELELEIDTKTSKQSSAGADGQTFSKAQLIEQDFEKLWKLYPRKERKPDAKKAYKKAIKAGIDNKTIQDGIVRYKQHIQTNRIEGNYIAQGGTWFNQQRWEDEYEAVSAGMTNNEPYDYRKELYGE